MFFTNASHILDRFNLSVGSISPSDKFQVFLSDPVTTSLDDQQKTVLLGDKIVTPNIFS